MRTQDHLNDPSYRPRRLMVAAAVEIGASSISNMATRIGFDPGQMSRIIHRRQRISGDMLVAIMDRTGWTIAKVRDLVGMPFNAEGSQS